MLFLKPTSRNTPGFSFPAFITTAKGEGTSPLMRWLPDASTPAYPDNEQNDATATLAYARVPRVRITGDCWERLFYRPNALGDA